MGERTTNIVNPIQSNSIQFNPIIKKNIQTTMAGNNKTLEKRRKFECEVCAKAYTSQGPFDKHIGKCMKDPQTKEVTSQTTEETNETSKNDEAVSEVEEIMIEDHEISIDQDDLELLEWFMSDQNINLSNEDQEENQNQFN